MKVMIMTDLEGPSGINGRSDGIGNKTVNLPTACQVLMDEVNACVRGLVKAGASEVLVWDGHGGSNSMDITKLHPAASLGDYGGDLAPNTQIDASFDAAILLGFHAMEGVIDGYMSHSYDSHHVCNMWLNNELIGEIGLNIYKSAYFGVPTIMVTGDQAACREALEFDPQLKTVITKKSLSRYTTINRPPQAVQKEIEQTAAAALSNLKSYKVKSIPAQLEYKVQYMCPNNVTGHIRTGWELVNPTTVVTHSNDFLDVYAQRSGWAPGLHNRFFGITPEWRGL